MCACDHSQPLPGDRMLPLAHGDEKYPVQPAEEPQRPAPTQPSRPAEPTEPSTPDEPAESTREQAFAVL